MFNSVFCRRAPGISHLLFADDTLLFFKAEECDVGTIQDIKTILRVEEDGFEAKYLGLPTPEGRMNKGKFQSLQEKLSKRVLQWGENSLSQGGKEVMIKAVAQAIPTYVMGVFKLPAGIFGGGLNRGRGRLIWVAWDVMLRPKNMGGLGFKDMQTFNQALLSRQVWRLIDKPDSLCARVLKAKYYPNGSLVDTVFTGNASSSWQAIEFGHDLVKNGIIWRIGNGEDVRV
ncbi:uncharacterized protein LOC106866712 [Brachypodium distachyon]|uniref:uncharacterized protein LOC106866712 n=1 Tax=Brachypodium distachyon TaxID=15368 RepID=UPI00071E33A3|nr:uncharacterized protein LOC106866712 [Brachypodium distachyon]|eukprot:XP_014757848.1 uncharacterized protein LOC106866712 [Brachypodium distachyon]